MLDKAGIREKYLKKRDELSEGFRKASSECICANIISSVLFSDSRIIALYYAINSEVDVMPLMSVKNKTYVFPKVYEENLEFSAIETPQSFKKGIFNIPEPVTPNNIDINKINLLIVPGIVFDRKGNRLGYGKGFYDRLLTKHPNITTVGVCYSDFMLESLIVDPWDVRVDYIVTQQQTIKTKEEVA